MTTLSPGEGESGRADVALDRFYEVGAYRPATEAVAALDRLWALSLLLGELMQRGLAERGITLARAAVISLLARGGPSTQRALSLVLRVTPRNITGLVDALEGEGLVIRAPHPSDRRATLVSLTEAGTALATTLKRDQDAFAERLFGQVNPETLRAFTGTVDSIVVQVEQRLKSAR
ncbi:MAG: MarR family transcriptional regulator [Candidatus Dormibacteraeota bacterium]|jgi:DNA-binding MarR family transcriptional regulator|nr:MarR family transcriptional regulator [Candidatus Dormibacteraeota bacterium]